jgi:hypothetical protein
MAHPPADHQRPIILCVALHPNRCERQPPANAAGALASHSPPPHAGAEHTRPDPDDERTGPRARTFRKVTKLAPGDGLPQL